MKFHHYSQGKIGCIIIFLEAAKTMGIGPRLDKHFVIPSLDRIIYMKICQMKIYLTHSRFVSIKGCLTVPECNRAVGHVLAASP